MSAQYTLTLSVSTGATTVTTHDSLASARTAMRRTMRSLGDLAWSVSTPRLDPPVAYGYIPGDLDASLRIERTAPAAGAAQGWLSFPAGAMEAVDLYIDAAGFDPRGGPDAIPAALRPITASAQVAQVVPGADASAADIWPSAVRRAEPTRERPNLEARIRRDRAAWDARPQSERARWTGAHALDCPCRTCAGRAL